MGSNIAQMVAETITAKLFTSDLGFNIKRDIGRSDSSDTESESENSHKGPKFSDTLNVCCNHPKFKQRGLSIRKKCPKGLDGMANSVDPD